MATTSMAVISARPCWRRKVMCSPDGAKRNPGSPDCGAEAPSSGLRVLSDERMSAIDQKKSREFTAPGKRQFYFHAAWKDFTDSFGRPLIQPRAGRREEPHAKFLHMCEQGELLRRALWSLIEHRPHHALHGAVDQAVGDTLHIAARAGIERQNTAAREFHAGRTGGARVRRLSPESGQGVANRVTHS